MKKSFTSIGGISFAFMLTVASTSFQAQIRSSSDTISKNNTLEASGLSLKTWGENKNDNFTEC
jgi:hypothetical protein